MRKDNLRDGRVRNWFYLENDLLDREDLSIYEKIKNNKGAMFVSFAKAYAGKNKINLNFR